MIKKNSLAKRVFTLTDQKKFSIISGDFNPIHINLLEARKHITGEVIVHGINCFLWALEFFVKRKNTFYSEVQVKFLSPIILGVKVELQWENKNNELRIKDENNKVYTIIKYKKKKFEKSDFLIVSDYKKEKNKPLNLNLNDINCGKRLVRFNSGKKEYIKKYFPYLVKAIGENCVYEIANLSSIVGMDIPGLNSLFLGLNIFFKKSNNTQVLNVLKYNKLGFISLDYQGKNFVAELHTCFRPKPIKTPSYNYIKKNLTTKLDLSGKDVLVIGGSRGIGAIICKISSAYKANITLTYNKGFKEAQTIFKDLNKNGVNIKILHLDVTDNNSFNKIKKTYDYIYYFATPKIVKNNSSKFDKKLFKKYLIYYEDSFRKILKLRHINNHTKILYPSTSYIDKNVKGLEEYIKAKVKGEMVSAEFLKNKFLKIYKPRLPALLTDQNISIIPKKYNDLLKVSEKLVKMMH